MLETMKILQKNRFLLFCLSATTTLVGCSKLYDLPEDRDFISENINYLDKVIEPVLGRNNLFTSLQADNSTLPMQFEIVNPRYGDGQPVTDLFTPIETYQWIAEYDGKETSLEEIQAKRQRVTRPAFEVDSNGRFILWAEATAEQIAPRPADTVLRTQDIRFFDLKVSNSGGERLIKDFQVIPWLERPYYPDTDINPYTGGPAPDPQRPRDTTRQDYIIPNYITNVVGQNTELPLVNNSEKKDIIVYIRPFTGGNGHNLRFRFMGSDGEYLNPALFNETKWDELVHGFNRKNEEDYVQYDVAYPIPLTNIRTDYSDGGGTAQIEFAYARMGFGGVVTLASFGLNFNIFKPGDWEIVFHFQNENPKFEDE